MKPKAFSLIELSIVILVIGILIAGVTQSSRLIRQMRLATARTMTQSSAVSSIKDLVTWFESTSEASFDDVEAAEGSIITNWYDINPQSSLKNNAQQSGATNLHPTYKANCINNLPCVQFNGSSNYIDTLQSLGTVNALSLFVVVSFNALAPSEYSIVATNGTWATGTTFAFKQLSNYVEYQLPNSVSIDTGAVVAKNNYVVEIIDDYTNGTTYSNGTAGTPSTTGVTKSLGTLNIGAWYNGSTRVRYFNGNIGEIILFSRALKGEERVAVESYLGKKWNIKW